MKIVLSIIKLTLITQIIPVVVVSINKTIRKMLPIIWTFSFTCPLLIRSSSGPIKTMMRKTTATPKKLRCHSGRKSTNNNPSREQIHSKPRPPFITIARLINEKSQKIKESPWKINYKKEFNQSNRKISNFWTN